MAAVSAQTGQHSGRYSGQRPEYDSANHNWAAGFFHFCNRHSWTAAPKGKSFTVMDVAASTTSALAKHTLSDHEMQWGFDRVAEARPKGLNPHEVLMYMAFARYAKISIDEVTEIPEAPGALAYFVKNGRGRWEWRRPGSALQSVELSSDFGQYFEDYLLFLGIDASEPLPQQPLFPQRRRPSAGFSAFSLAKHLARFRTLLGDAANQSSDPLISASEAKFRRINFTMIRRNPIL